MRVILKITAVFLTAAAIITAAVLPLAAGANALYYPLKFTAAVEESAAEYGLEQSLVYAVIHTESKFNEKAVSRKGAKGLMQLMPETAEWLAAREGAAYSEERLLNAEYNIKLGCAYLKYLLNKYGGVNEALAAYNAGEGNVTRWLTLAEYSENGRLTRAPFAETRGYLNKTAKAARVYKGLLTRGFYI